MDVTIESLYGNISGCYMVISPSSCLITDIGQGPLSTLPKRHVQSLIRTANGLEDLVNLQVAPSKDILPIAVTPSGTFKTWDFDMFTFKDCV